jgi:hypothetical protein
MEALLKVIGYLALLVVVPSIVVLWSYVGRAIAALTSIDKEPPLHLSSVIGFLFYCLVLVVLKLFIPSWLVCLIIASLVCGMIGRKVTADVSLISQQNFYSFHWLLWSVVNLILAVSLFDQEKGISTLWKNNYGDLAFHLGMITNMAFSPSGIVEFHLASGESLNYPIFLNMITAALWSMAPTFGGLKVVFVIIWLWSAWVLWGAFKGSIWIWPVLLGGSCFYYLGTFSSEYIDSNGFWTSFLSSIWVPQRTSWTGIAICSTLLVALNRCVDQVILTRKNAFWLGLFFGISTMAHFHSALIMGVLGGLLLVFFSSENIKQRLVLGSILASSAAVGALLFLHWYGSKASSLELTYCWSTHRSAHAPLQQCVLSLSSWGVSLLPLWAIIWGLFSLRNRSDFKMGKRLLVFLALFIFGNTVKMVYWNWDQIKIFASLYVALMLFFASNHKDIFNTSKVRFFSYLMLVLLCVPSAYEVAKYVRKDNYQLFSPQDIFDAEVAKRLLTPGEPIIAEALHNSPMVLSGHPLYLGYAGTLWSHGMQVLSDERTEKLKSFCDETLPRYVYARQGDFFDRVQAAGCFVDRGDGFWERIKTIPANNS